MTIQSVHDGSAHASVVAALRAGALVIVPTDTVYGVAAAASAPGAAAAIATLKGRPADKPLAVLVADMAQAESLIELSAAARALADQHWPGALTLIGRRTETAEAIDLGHTGASIGVRWPAHPWLQSVMHTVGPLIVTSANRSGEPAAVTAAEADQAFAEDLLVIDDGTKDGPASAVVQVEPFAILRPGVLFPDGEAADNPGS